MKKDEDIHHLIKEKFGTNRHHDERFSRLKYAEWAQSNAESVENDESELENLSESDSPYYRHPLTGEEEARLHTIRNVWPTLTARQKQVIFLCGIKEYTPAAAARTMGVSSSAVHYTLKAARKKFQKAHKAEENSFE